MSTSKSFKRRPKALFLCQTLPYPPDGGVQIRAFHLLRLLAEHFSVTALCFFRASTRPTDDQVRAGVEGLRRETSVEAVYAFPIDQEHSRTRFVWDHLRSLILRRPYTVYAYESREFRRTLHALLSRDDFDLIHVDSLDLSGFLRDLPAVPVVCDHHNVESALLMRRAEHEPNWIRSWYLRHQARLMAREERHWCDRVDLNLTVSSPDRDLLREGSPESRITVVANGVDTETFQPSYGGDGGLVFVGGYTWFPNRDGMEYFVERILPLVRERVDGVPIRWVGRVPEEVGERYRAEFSIEVTGYVDDIRPYVESASCYVVPLRVGGGTRLKILDAWAMGKAVVSTSRGCEGLEARNGENILIEDTEEGFASAVVRTLQDPDLQATLGQAGRTTAEDVYDWRVVGGKMLSEIRTLL